MAASSLYVLHNLLTRRRDSAHQTPTLKSFFVYMPTTLALATSLLILLYISSTSNLFFINPHHLHFAHPKIGASLNHEKPTNSSPSSPSRFVDFTGIPRKDGGVGVAEDRSALELEMGSHG